MNNFYLTFGSQYAHRDHWVRIVAPNDATARSAAVEHFGSRWSMLYEERDFTPDSLRRGELFAFSADENLNYRYLEKQEVL